MSTNDARASSGEDSNDARPKRTPMLAEPAPEYDPREFDPDSYRADIATRVREAATGRTAASGPVVFSDDPGAGKTTTAGLTADEEGIPHALLFAMHAKARDYVTDPVTPDGYLELRGGSQPQEDCCMDTLAAARLNPDAKASDAACNGVDANGDRHHDESFAADEWPLMCPVFSRDRDDPVRKRYDRLTALVGAGEAHVILGDDLHEGRCEWQKRQSRIQNAEKIVGVHEYQTRRSIRENFLVITDETPRELKTTERVTTNQIGRAANYLREHVEGAETPFAAFCDRLRDAITRGESVENVEPPALSDAGDAGYYLARLKLRYNEAARATLTRDDRPDEKAPPNIMHALIAAAAEAGADRDDCMRAIGGPDTLRYCPLCGTRTTGENGALRCTGEACGWTERERELPNEAVQNPARALAWTDPGREDDDTTLVYEALPPVSDLPKTPLVLDATATPEKIGAFYGAYADEVTVTGTDTLATNMVVGQVTNGAYHAGTLKRKASANVRNQIQNHIDDFGEDHDRPLFGIQRKLMPLFDWPENAQVLHYGGARGMNLGKCDAVMCIGAPHPQIDDLRRTARLLCSGRPDLYAGGGVEYSARRPGEDYYQAGGVPVFPAEYKPYRPGEWLEVLEGVLPDVDEPEGVPEDHTVAIPTKTFDGLTGELFHEAREKEIEQFVHRVRPVLSSSETEAPIPVMLFTKAPTNLPVNRLVSWYSDDPEPSYSPDWVMKDGEGKAETIAYLAKHYDGEFTVSDILEKRDHFPEGIGKRHVQKTLKRLAKTGHLEKEPGRGPKPARYRVCNDS